MFRLATAPQFAGLRLPKLASMPCVNVATVATERTASPATADIRIRRFGDASVSEDTYTAILPSDALSPADLMRAITEACKDLPEFQIRDQADERFILTLTLKG
jgi:hypothetical protein